MGKEDPEKPSELEMFGRVGELIRSRLRIRRHEGTDPATHPSDPFAYEVSDGTTEVDSPYDRAAEAHRQAVSSEEPYGEDLSSDDEWARSVAAGEAGALQEKFQAEVELLESRGADPATVRERLITVAACYYNWYGDADRQRNRWKHAIREVATFLGEDPDAIFEAIFSSEQE